MERLELIILGDKGQRALLMLEDAWSPFVPRPGPRRLKLGRLKLNGKVPRKEPRFKGGQKQDLVNPNNLAQMLYLLALSQGE